MSRLHEALATFEHTNTAKVSFLLLMYLDLVLTLWAFQLGFSELNPLMVRMLSNPTELVLVKVASPIFIVSVVPGKYLIPAILFLTFVVAWNLKELLFFYFL